MKTGPKFTIHSNLDKISDVRIRMSNNLHPCLTLRDSDGGYLQAPYYFRWSKKEQWEQVVKRAAAARGITTHWDKGDHESKW